MVWDYLTETIEASSVSNDRSDPWDKYLMVCSLMLFPFLTVSIMEMFHGLPCFFQRCNKMFSARCSLDELQKKHVTIMMFHHYSYYSWYTFSSMAHLNESCFFLVAEMENWPSWGIICGLPHSPPILSNILQHRLRPHFWGHLFNKNNNCVVL